MTKMIEAIDTTNYTLIAEAIAAQYVEYPNVWNLEVRPSPHFDVISFWFNDGYGSEVYKITQQVPKHSIEKV